MNFRKDIWFSPILIIDRFLEVLKNGESELRQRKYYKEMDEAFIVAQFILGMRKRHDVELFLQIVDPKEQAPDIRIMTNVKVEDMFKIQVVHLTEVVTHEVHSPEGVAEFLLRTKLNDRKIYQDTTTIICWIAKESEMESFTEITRKLNKVKKNIQVFLMYVVSIDPCVFRISLVYPGLKHVVEFNPHEEVKVPYSKSVVRIFKSISMETKKESYIDPFD